MTTGLLLDNYKTIAVAWVFLGFYAPEDHVIYAAAG